MLRFHWHQEIKVIYVQKRKYSQLATNRKTRWNHEARIGIALASPAILGFLLFCVIPIILSGYLSFTDWNIFKPAKYIGFSNYIKIFTNDYLFNEAIKATFKFAIGSTISSTLFAFMLALLLNVDVKGKAIYRTIFYLPSIVPAVANAVLWSWLYNKDFGLFNSILRLVGIPKQSFLAGQTTVIPSLIFMAMWGCGGAMIIYLAGIQGVPTTLKEAVRIDGGNYWHELTQVIIPLVSPVIFFNVLMGLVGSFQVFTQAFMMTQGGPNNKSLFYSYYLYSTAFAQNKMGYASALGWVMFIIMIIFTATFFKVFSKHVFYEGGSK
jgi:multiple sugar transport system permease protein